eukprot:6517678-Pyramimonas_sp.AAC.1
MALGFTHVPFLFLILPRSPQIVKPEARSGPGRPFGCFFRGHAPPARARRGEAPQGPLGARRQAPCVANRCR